MIICESCEAEFKIKVINELPVKFCPFCGEEHENIEEEFTDIDNNWD